MIPKQIKDFNFVLNAGNGKQPIERGWQKKIHRINDRVLQEHLKKGLNYGVQPNNTSIIINDETHLLGIIDFDTKEFQDKVLSKFPETFTTTSGSDKNCYHLWFATDDNKAFKIKNEKFDTLADFIGSGNQVIAPGSKHQKSGSIYSVVKDVPIVFLPYSEIAAILKPHDTSPKKVKKPTKQYIPKDSGADFSQKMMNSISMENILSILGIDTSKNPTECPLHSSKGGKCLSYTDEIAHCFHCDSNWNKFSLVRESKNLTDKETFDWLSKEAGMEEELLEDRKKYADSKKKDKPALSNIFSRRGQIESFWEKQPFYYDKYKIFWLWNLKDKRWEKSDEIDFLNGIQETLGVETIDSKVRGELEAGFKQVGRKHKPEEIKKTWVQFKEKIYDIKTGEVFKASPKYFVTNPIPWNVGESEDTPTIDKYFEEWVGAGHKRSLYEFIAYSISLNKFMQRVFGFCGGGSNGKGTYIKIVYKFLGDENCVTSELRLLSEDKFEPATLYRKLLCVMGEVSHNDLRNTNMIKKLGGEDKISFQFKGKTPFTEENTATCVSLTNSLPITPDKTIGFYRKWKIEDFPNEFPKIKEDLIAAIPNVEFENLAKKSLRILKELYEKMEFHKEGDYQYRKDRYEERSNPVMRFIEKFCEENPESNIPLREFTTKCNEYLEDKHLRPQNIFSTGKILRNEGYDTASRDVNGGRAKVILGVGFIDNSLSETLQSLQTPQSELDVYKGTNSKSGVSGDCGDFQRENEFEEPVETVKIGLSDEEFEALPKPGEV